MRNPTPLAPGHPVSNVTVHVVLNDFGPLGRAYVETDEVDADVETIVEGFLTGQYSHPLRVVALQRRRRLGARRHRGRCPRRIQPRHRR